MLKTCPICRETSSNFYKCKDGYYQSYCKPCHSSTRKVYLLKYRYGLTPEDYENLLKGQDYKCAICKMTCKQRKILSVDHCHTTGKIRGLLCSDCNTTLGKFNDDVSRFQSAINYLNRNL